MATNFVTANYQEVIDLHTESNTVSVIGIHTPNTVTPVKMLSGFWDQFRKVKYNGCSISLVPAARLPADPLQVSYAAGEPTIDPRDMLNPILFHGCHGNDMGTILNTLYSGQPGNSEVARNCSDSTEQNVWSETQVGNDFVDALYYKALTDRTWLKAHPQAGFRKSGLRPMVHRVVANMSYGALALDTGVASTVVNPTAGGGTDTQGQLGQYSDHFTAKNAIGIPVLDGTKITVGQTGQSGQAFMTSKLEPMGWHDTHAIFPSSNVTSEALTGDAAGDASKIGRMWAHESLNPRNTIPKVFMGMIMLPPAYKTEQYFRMVINHNFAFKGFRGVSMQNDSEEMVNNASSVFNFN